MLTREVQTKRWMKKVKQTQQKDGTKKNTSYLLAQKKVDIILVEAHLFSDKPATFGEK